MSTDFITPLLTAEDVALTLNISVSTLRKNVSVNPSAVPPFLKLGKASNSPVRWRQQDVEQWLMEQFNATKQNQI